MFPYFLVPEKFAQGRRKQILGEAFSCEVKGKRSNLSKVERCFTFSTTVVMVMDVILGW